MTTWRIDSPVAIGGLGGSGTRLVAALLQDWGVYLGADLNPQMDNLWFTLLFKRASCLRDVMLLHGDAVEALYRVFAAPMQGRRIGPLAWPLLFRATVEVAVRGHNHRGEGKGRWAFQRAFRMLTASAPAPEKCLGWGWKEPNTHVYLRLLAACEPRLRYVHVVRHGLDMAFSKNDQQLRLWGKLYDLELAPNADPTPADKLAVWIRANRRALNTGVWMGPARFHVVRFDDLCRRPEPTIRELAAFVGIPNPDIPAACRRVRVPESFGRYRNENLSVFSDSALEEVRRMGFEIQGLAAL